MKKCSKCGVVQAMDQYAFQIKSKGKLHPWCRTCRTRSHLEWRSGIRNPRPPQRFVLEEVDGGCVICVSHKRKSRGYTRVKVKGVHVNLHRHFFEQKNGPIPEGLIVRHKCDNRACVNVDHLELGTHQDNMDDMVNRKRTHTGSSHKNAKLNEDQVREIRSSAMPIRALARKYGVSRTTMSSIVKGKTWKHVV